MVFVYNLLLLDGLNYSFLQYIIFIFLINLCREKLVAYQTMQISLIVKCLIGHRDLALPNFVQVLQQYRYFDHEFKDKIFGYFNNPLYTKFDLIMLVQIEHSAEEDEARIKAASTETSGPNSEPNSTICKGKRKRTEASDSKGRMRTSKNKVNAKDQKSKRICKVTAAPAELSNITDQDKEEGNKYAPLIQKGKSRKGKKVLSDAGVQENDGVEPLANRKDTLFAQFSDSVIHKQNNEGRVKPQKTGEGNKSTMKSTQRLKSGGLRKTQKSQSGMKCLDTEQGNEGMISQLLTDLHPPGNDREISDRCIKRSYEKNCKKLSSSVKKVKFCAESMSKDNHDGIALGANVKESCKARGHTFHKITDERDQSDMKTPSKIDSVSSRNGHVLLKCNTSPNAILCAFCQSSEESEVNLSSQI